jgi:transcriptional regulator with XRE-family HTH domain
MSAPTTYTQRLAQCMKDLGLEPKDLAAAVGFSIQAAKKLYIGTSKMANAENNVHIAAWLGVSSEWLATGKGDKKAGASPFSRELMLAAWAASPADRRKAENAARNVLDLDPLPPEETRAAPAHVPASIISLSG